MSGNLDRFARPRTTAISPFELNVEGRGQALVLRYANCNLRCPLCYAWKYAWLPTMGHSYSARDCSAAIRQIPTVIQGNRKIVWVRIQGGEPCLTPQRVANTIDFAGKCLQLINQRNLNYYADTRAVVQTNGLLFAGLNRSQIVAIRQQISTSLTPLERGRLVFEFSFKSPNDPNTVNTQLRAFSVLLNQVMLPLWNTGLANLALYPVAGLGPSVDFGNNWIVPIDSSLLPNEIPLFDRSTWSSGFQNMYNDFLHNVVPNHSTYKEFRNNPRTCNGTKIAIEEFEPAPFQTSWISGYSGKYAQSSISVPPITQILRKSSSNWDPVWLGLCGRYPAWHNVFSKIPVCSNFNSLMGMILNMASTFYPSHPSGHYPYL